MKITDVRAYTVLGRSIFVRVTTDDGITGIGECSPMQVQSGVIQQFVNGMLRPICVGQNPLEIDKLYHAMYYRPYKLGVMGAHLSAIAGVDIALWDILGKVTGLPIHTLLGGCYRDKVRMYASLGGGGGRHPPQPARPPAALVADRAGPLDVRRWRPWPSTSTSLGSPNTPSPPFRTRSTSPPTP